MYQLTHWRQLDLEAVVSRSGRSSSVSGMLPIPVETSPRLPGLGGVPRRALTGCCCLLLLQIGQS